MKIILASRSPRRRELLERMGIQEFEVIPAQGEEAARPGLSPGELVEELSRRKCAEVAAAHPGALVIAADTVVSIDGRILGKPRSGEEAVQMLSELSGREHVVYSGVTVRQGGRAVTEHEATPVRFRPLLVEGITGDYYNVMGLPVCRLGRILKSFGVDPLALAAEKEFVK